jgi:hypothetical protein
MISTLECRNDYYFLFGKLVSKFCKAGRFAKLGNRRFPRMVIPRKIAVGCRERRETIGAASVKPHKRD